MPKVIHLTFWVDGKPRPKGSMRSVGRGVMVEDNKDSKPWRERVLSAAKEAATAHGQWKRHEGPVVVAIACYFDPPKSAPKTRQTWPSTRSTGDADKLARNVLDAIVDAGIIRDDSQVVTLSVSKIHTTDPLLGTPHTPGAYVTVGALGEALR